MPLTLKQNLTMAQAAINHTSAKLSLGAQNDHQNPNQADAQRAVVEMRVEMSQLLGSSPIHRVAAFAKSAKAGNCGEQAAVAFEFLKNHGVFPLDIMRLTSGDHGWVVVGRVAGSNAANYETLGGLGCHMRSMDTEVQQRSVVGRKVRHGRRVLRLSSAHRRSCQPCRQVVRGLERAGSLSAGCSPVWWRGPRTARVGVSLHTQVLEHGSNLIRCQAVLSAKSWQRPRLAKTV
jgi:hypothetical protein